MNLNKRVRESPTVSLENMEDESESSNEPGISEESFDIGEAAMELNDTEENEWLDMLRCPLCAEVYTDCTLISGCLDKFCTECIRKKLKEDGARGCPVCHSDLGDNPEQYLRHVEELSKIASKLMEVFRIKKGMPPNSRDDKLEPDASEVQDVLQDSATSRHHGDLTENKHDPATSDENKHVPEKKEIAQMIHRPPSENNVLAKRAKKN